VNQPLGAIANNAGECVRWLGSDNLDEARRSAALIIADAHRAGEIISRIRALAKKAPPQKGCLDLNETIGEVIALARGELNAMECCYGPGSPMICPLSREIESNYSR
jgi:C4-dicarboxylate-specific signal transduction histidine kinase